MKKQVKKLIVIALIWVLIAVLLVINRTTYAEEQQQQQGLTVSIVTNKNNYEPGDEIEIKVKLNKKVMTASYYLNYNSSELTYKESKTANLVVKDYPSDNLVRVMYADITGTGVEEMKLVFTAKNNSKNAISFNLTNATMTTSQDSKSYFDSQITGIQNNLTINLKEKENEDNTISNEVDTNTVENKVDNKVNINTIENKVNTIENKVNTNTIDNKVNNKVSTNTINNDKNTNNVNNSKDKTYATENIPKTGTNDIIFAFLGVMLILTTIYFGYNVKKLGRDF